MAVSLLSVYALAFSAAGMAFEARKDFKLHLRKVWLLVICRLIITADSVRL